MLKSFFHRVIVIVTAVASYHTHNSADSTLIRTQNIKLINNLVLQCNNRIAMAIRATTLLTVIPFSPL